MSSISADMSSTETDTKMSVPFSALFSTLLVSGSDQRLEWETKNTARKMQNYLEWTGDILNNPQHLESVTGRLKQNIMNQVIDLRELVSGQTDGTGFEREDLPQMDIDSEFLGKIDSTIRALAFYGSQQVTKSELSELTDDKISILEYEDHAMSIPSPTRAGILKDLKTYSIFLQKGTVTDADARVSAPAALLPEIDYRAESVGSIIDDFGVVSDLLEGLAVRPGRSETDPPSESTKALIKSRRPNNPDYDTRMAPERYGPLRTAQ